MYMYARVDPFCDSSGFLFEHILTIGYKTRVYLLISSGNVRLYQVDLCPIGTILYLFVCIIV